MTVDHDPDGNVLVDERDTTPRPHSAYQSPLMAQMGQLRLTHALLLEHVPVFQAGEEARARLVGMPETGSAVEENLRQVVAAGDRSKDLLVRAALPFVSALARKEHRRRVPEGDGNTGTLALDDLLQEGVIGLLDGLRKFDVTKQNVSMTNYLGSWVTVRMRRNTDHLTHSFHVGYTASERLTRIGAIRSRLAGELGRQPSDQEIVDAWSDPRFTGRGRMIGRKENRDREPKTTITLEQVREQRLTSSRVGMRNAPASSNADTDWIMEQQASPLDQGNEAYQPEQQAMAFAAQGLLADLLGRTMEILAVAETQKVILSMHFGLNGYPETPVKHVATAVNISRLKASQVVQAFTKEMARPNGAFHRACAGVDVDDLIDAGLGWVVDRLGRYDGSPPPVLPILCDPLGRAPVLPPPPAEPIHAQPGEVRAQFLCPAHTSGFVGAYRNEGEVPRERKCPRCDRSARLIRVLVA